MGIKLGQNQFGSLECYLSNFLSSLLLYLYTVHYSKLLPGRIKLYNVGYLQLMYIYSIKNTHIYVPIVYLQWMTYEGQGHQAVELENHYQKQMSVCNQD